MSHRAQHWKDTGMNTTLESLELDRVDVTDDKADLWCRRHHFLRNNRAPQIFAITWDQRNVTESCCHLRTNIAAMLQRTCHFSLSIRKLQCKSKKLWLHSLPRSKHNNGVEIFYSETR
jgi:hypothetical protein